MYGLPGQAPYNQAGVVGGHRIEIVCYTSRTSKGAIVQPVGRGWQRQDDACEVHALGQGGWVSTHWSGVVGSRFAHEERCGQPPLGLLICQLLHFHICPYVHVHVGNPV